MRVLVVSGFLGAGKTTFIQELARRTKRDFVIYENEYGQADIDAAMLSQSDELSVWESTENCICCSGKQDFASSVLAIANTLDPEYLVVEPTGVARLSSVIENVNRVSYERISLLKPLVIVDALAWEHQRDRFVDIYLDQVKSAPVVVISKVQHAGMGQVDAVRSWICELNPSAQIIDVVYSELPDEWFTQLLQQDLDPERAGTSAHSGGAVQGGAVQGEVADDEFESLSLAGISLSTEGHLIWFLADLVAGVFGEVVRAKGSLPCGGQWLRFDVVDRAWSVTGAEPAEDGEKGALGVFIGANVRRPLLREALLPLVREAVAKGHPELADDDSLDYHDEHEHEHAEHEHGEHKHTDHTEHEHS